MSLVGYNVYVNGWECTVLDEGVGYRELENGDVEFTVVITVSRLEGPHVLGGISIGNIPLNSPSVFLPPSSFDYRLSEWQGVRWFS